MGIAGAGSWREATVFVAGVFLGSALWYLLLSGTVGALRSRLDLSALRWVNRLAGVVLVVFGVTALAWR
jgi:arginine exporter protein ArgO